MGFLDFIASIVGSLAWPSAVFGSVVLFRRELIPLLPRLRVKKGDLDVAFDRLEQVAQKVDHLPPPPPEDLLPPPTPQEKITFDQLAEQHPRAALLDARADLEQAVREAALKLGLEDAARRPTGYLLRSMRKWVPDDLQSALESLRQLGNNAAHNSDATSVSPHEAKLFRSISDKVIANLAAIAKVRRDIA